MSSLVLGSFMIKIIANMVKDRQHLRFSMCEGLGFRLSGRCFLSAYLPTSLLKIQMGIFLTSSSFCLISCFACVEIEIFVHVLLYFKLLESSLKL